MSSGPVLSITGIPSVKTQGVVTLGASAPSISSAVLCRAAEPIADAESPSFGGAASSLPISLDSTFLGDGSFAVSGFAIAGGVLCTTSEPLGTLTIANLLTQAYADDFAEAGGNDALRMSFAFTESVESWTVAVMDEYDVAIATRSGSGNSAKLDWPTIYEAGSPAPAGCYSVHVTYTWGGDEYSITRPFSIVPQNPNFLGFIHRFAEHSGDQQYSRDLLEQLRRMNTFYPNSVRPAVFVKSGHARTTPQFKYQIRRWLKLTGAYFYLDAHGFGKFSTSANIHEAYWADMVFANYTPAASAGAGFIAVPQVVGARQYRFVWIDACQSAGVGSYSPESMTTSPNNGWASAFNVNLGQGAFVGWNGNAAQMFSAGGVPNAWYHWSKKFWEHCANGYSVFDAHLLATIDTVPPYGVTYYPWSTITVGGSIYAKRHQIGDTTLP